MRDGASRRALGGRAPAAQADRRTVPGSFTGLIPITAAERNYKKENGVEALETLFEEHSLDYLNPSRASLV